MGALELEGVEVRVQIGEKNTIEDLVLKIVCYYKQLSSRSSTSNFVYVAFGSSRDDRRVHDICQSLGC